MRTRSTLLTILFCTALGATPAAAGNWVVNTNSLGTTVSNERTGESFRAVNHKAGEKQAKRLNRIEDKEAKSNGVMASDIGPCADPTSGVLC